MENKISRFIVRYSKPQQILLVLLTVTSYPFLYFSLDLPKTIINKAIGGKNIPTEFLGIPMDQIRYLLILCGLFLALVIVNGAFKFAIHVYQGIVGERMLRRLRYQLVTNVLRFPLPHFRNISQGEIVAMVAQETEPLGGFIGESFVTPSYEGGQMLTILFFLFVQDWTLGLAAIALYPVQGYLIPVLQRKVNQLAKERIMTVRTLSQRLGELVSGASDVHAHGTAQYELADFGHRLGTIYGIRYRIYMLKFFIKFLNGFFDKLTPFFFFSIGGYLVIDGDLSFGALVAALAAYKEIAPHWKELLNYYQHLQDAQVKYDQLIERFQPPGLMDERLLQPIEETVPLLAGNLVTANLSMADDEGNKRVDNVSLSFDIDKHVTLIGPAGSGKTEFAQLIARQIFPTSGSITINGVDTATLPEAVTGRRIAYADQDAYIASGTIRNNLLYALKHHPTRPATVDDEIDVARNRARRESLLSGNSPFEVDADWVDYELIGAKDGNDVSKKIIESLAAVQMDDDVFRLGWRRLIDPEKHSDLTRGVIQARRTIHKRLEESDYREYVEIFDKDSFNSNASIAENILFGTPVDKTFDMNNLGDNPYVLAALNETGLTQDFLEMGQTAAALMVELFKDLPPGHEFFERFSFIDAEALPSYQRILKAVATKGLEGIDAKDRTYLINLPFKLVPARHRLDLIDDTRKQKLLDARRAFERLLPAEARPSIEFFDVERYNSASSILDNILFGKIVIDKRDAGDRVGDLIKEVTESMGLRPAIIDIGLDFDVGIGGKRLTPTQRHKMALARALVKNPQILISNEAAAAFDPPTEMAVFANIREIMRGRGLIWVKGDARARKEATDNDVFDHVFLLQAGKARESKREDDVGAAKMASGIPAPIREAADDDAKGGDVLGKDAELLATIPFFAGLDLHKLKLLAFTSERQTLAPDEDLFNQGDLGEMAYVVVDGEVDVLVSTVEGEVKVAAAGRGDLIGELALLCDAPRTATIRAKGPVTFLKIAKDVFLKLIEDNPQVSLNVTRIVAGRLEKMMRGIDRLRQPLYDEVTGLPNKNLFLDRVKHAVSEDKRAGKISALILVTLSEFDGIGDRIGTEAEAPLLKEIARRFRNSLREGDSVARLDQYAFGIIAKGTVGESDIQHVVKRIESNLARPFAVGNGEIKLTEKLRFDVYPLDQKNIDKAAEII